MLEEATKAFRRATDPEVEVNAYVPMPPKSRRPVVCVSPERMAELENAEHELADLKTLAGREIDEHLPDEKPRETSTGILSEAFKSRLRDGVELPSRGFMLRLRDEKHGIDTVIDTPRRACQEPDGPSTGEESCPACEGRRAGATSAAIRAPS